LNIDNPVYGAELENTFPLFADETNYEAKQLFSDLVAITEQFKVWRAAVMICSI
jgi:hypothetical protein